MDPVLNDANSFLELGSLLNSLEGQDTSEHHEKIGSLAERVRVLIDELRQEFKDVIKTKEVEEEPIVPFDKSVMNFYERMVPVSEYKNWGKAGGLIVLALIEARFLSANKYLTHQEIAQRIGLAISTIASSKYFIEGRLIHQPYYLDCRRGMGWRLGMTGKD